MFDPLVDHGVPGGSPLLLRNGKPALMPIINVVCEHQLPQTRPELLTRGQHLSRSLLVLRGKPSVQHLRFHSFIRQPGKVSQVSQLPDTHVNLNVIETHFAKQICRSDLVLLHRHDSLARETTRHVMQKNLPLAKRRLTNHTTLRALGEGLGLWF